MDTKYLAEIKARLDAGRIPMKSDMDALLADVERLTEENDVLKSECKAHIRQAQNRRPTMPTESDAYRTLITVPANDGNFIWALKKYATREDLLKAQYYLEDHPAGNKSRLRAVNQEIRRRQKEARNG